MGLTYDTFYVTRYLRLHIVDIWGGTPVEPRKQIDRLLLDCPSPLHFLSYFKNICKEPQDFIL